MGNNTFNFCFFPLQFLLQLRIFTVINHRCGFVVPYLNKGDVVMLHLFSALLKTCCGATSSRDGWKVGEGGSPPGGREHESVERNLFQGMARLVMYA